MSRQSYQVKPFMGHTHTAMVNTKGDGRTTMKHNHIHAIVNWRIYKAGIPKHTHKVVRPDV